MLFGKIHSFIHAFIHSFFHSLIYSFIQSFIHLFNQSFIHRAEFRHVQEMQLHRAPTKRVAPTNKGPRAKANSDKGSP
jgi:hypothetical protein